VADSRAEEALKRADKAFEAIAGYHALCQHLAETFYPERATFTCEEAIGDENYRHVYDGHPILMRYRLGNAIGAMSRGRGREWFRAKSFPYHLNKRQAVTAWNDDTTETQRAILYDPRAQFAPQMGLGDHDYVTFGTALEKITENNARTGVLFRTPHLKTAAPEENSEGVIDVTHERPRMTARMAGQMFAGQRRAMSRAMKEAIEKDPTGKLDCIAQCVMPLADYEPSAARRPPRGAQFVSLYMDRDEQTVLAEEYFWSFPYVWRRWMRSAAHVMGLSPCALVALADARMSQDIARTLSEAMEYAADPAKLIVASAIEGNIDLAPGGESYVNRKYDFRTGKAVEPVDNGAMPTYAFEYSKHKQAFIGQSWLVNILTLPQDRDLTKYEASKLLEEDAREAAPIFEPMEADNSAIMARVFSIADRWGAFAARPEELKGAEVRYEFETPVTIALDRLRAEQGLQAVDVVSRLGELELKFGQTEAFRRTEMAELQRDIFKGIGPASWLRDEAEAAADIESDKMEQQLGKALSVGKESGILDAMMQQGAPGVGAPQQPLALPAPAPANGA
jgi:hypothetical protein